MHISWPKVCALHRNDRHSPSRWPPARARNSALKDPNGHRVSKNDRTGTRKVALEKFTRMGMRVLGIRQQNSPSLYMRPFFGKTSQKIENIFDSVLPKPVIVHAPGEGPITEWIRGKTGARSAIERIGRSPGAIPLTCVVQRSFPESACGGGYDYYGHVCTWRLDFGRFRKSDFHDRSLSRTEIEQPAIGRRGRAIRESAARRER